MHAPPIKNPVLEEPNLPAPRVPPAQPVVARVSAGVAALAERAGAMDWSDLSVEEHQEFVRAVNDVGRRPAEVSWQSVSERIPNHSSESIKGHAVKYFVRLQRIQQFRCLEALLDAVSEGPRGASVSERGRGAARETRKEA